MNYEFVIVGGGVSGLLAANFAAAAGYKAIIIESGDSLGGGWRGGDVNFSNGEEVALDFGLRLPTLTGELEIDKIAYPDLSTEWNIYSEWLNEKSLYDGQVNHDSSCLALDHLTQSSQDLYISELNDCDLSMDCDGLSFSNRVYGESLTKDVLSRIYESLVGVGLNEISAKYLNYFLPRRILFDKAPFNSLMAHRRKAIPALSKPFLYPKSGRVDMWCDLLKRQFIELGGKIQVGSTIQKINENSAIVGNDAIQFSKLVWSTVPIVLAKTMGLSFDSPRPVFRDFENVHIWLDDKVNVNFDFLLNFDGRSDFYRAYNQRFFGKESSILSFERILSEGDNAFDANFEIKRLIECGLVSDHTIIAEGRVLRRNYLPLLSSEYDQALNGLMKEIPSNIKLIGRGIDGASFISDLIIQAKNVVC